MSVFHTLAMLALAVPVCACSHLRAYTMPEEENLLSGAGSLLTDSHGKPTSGELRSKSFEQLDLNLLLTNYGFNDVPALKPSDTDAQYRRNELQDRIISASNQRCGTYLRILTSAKAEATVGWRGLATFLSGAAAVVNPATLAKALAAGSTVSNSVLSTYDEAYFNSLAVTAISSGITRKREALLDQLTVTRKTSSLTEYPLNRAISDALTYHAACNVITGLEAAANATQKVSNQALVNGDLSIGKAKTP